MSQRDVFGEARYALSRAARSGEEGARQAAAGEADEILAMARWRSEEVLKSLRPLARAAFAIEAAAADTKSFGGRYHNPENSAPRQHQQVVQAA